MLDRLSHLEPKHWALIGTFLTADAAMIAGYDHWGDMLKPVVVAAFIGQVGAFISAVFTGAPVNPNLTPAENPGRRAEDVPLGNVSDATRSRL